MPLQEMNEKELKEFNNGVKAEKSTIKKGYDRVKEKIKSLRQDYRNAVNTGERSGSGRMIRDNWEDLMEIWAGSPATKAIHIDNGCTTQEINGENISTGFVETDDEETFMNSLFEKEDDANSQVKVTMQRNFTQRFLDCIAKII
jgi:hypothetical protein